MWEICALIFVTLKDKNASDPCIESANIIAILLINSRHIGNSYEIFCFLVKIISNYIHSSFPLTFTSKVSGKNFHWCFIHPLYSSPSYSHSLRHILLIKHVMRGWWKEEKPLASVDALNEECVKRPSFLLSALRKWKNPLLDREFEISFWAAVAPSIKSFLFAEFILERQFITRWL